MELIEHAHDLMELRIHMVETILRVDFSTLILYTNIKVQLETSVSPCQILYHLTLSVARTFLNFFLSSVLKVPRLISVFPRLFLTPTILHGAYIRVNNFFKKLWIFFRLFKIVVLKRI